MHAIEYAWLGSMRSVALYAYRLPAHPFRPFAEPEPARVRGEPEPSAHVAEVPVRPAGAAGARRRPVRPARGAGIELRVLPRLWSFWDAVAASTLGFSGIRLHNAQIA